MLSVSLLFPVMAKGFMRDRHALGESTYCGLLEMSLLGDERDVPWSKQATVLALVDTLHSRASLNRRTMAMEEQTQMRANDDTEFSSIGWWNHEAYGIVRSVRGGHGSGGNQPRDQVFDDDYLIRNVRPLALIVQYLPTMAYSVQVGHTPTCLQCLILYNAILL